MPLLKIDENCQSETFDKICKAYDEVRNSKEVSSACSLCSTEYGLSVLGKMNLTADKLVFFTVSYLSFSNREIGVILLPNTILVVLIKRNTTQFLCALLSSAFSVRFIETTNVSRSIVVSEKTREPIEYYDKYNKYTDSRIVSRHWDRTNLDGSRSFSGGLKPENNPLILTLEYGLGEIIICGLKVELMTSNASALKHLSSFYDYVSYADSCQPFNQERRLAIMNKCIDSYFKDSIEGYRSEKKSKRFLRLIKNNPILLIPLGIGLVFVVLLLILGGLELYLAILKSTI